MLLLTIASGSPVFDLATNGLAQNGYGAGSPGGYSHVACFLIEVVLTAGFLVVILGSTDDRCAGRASRR